MLYVSPVTSFTLLFYEQLLVHPGWVLEPERELKRERQNLISLHYHHILKINAPIHADNPSLHTTCAHERVHCTLRNNDNNVRVRTTLSLCFVHYLYRTFWLYSNSLSKKCVGTIYLTNDNKSYIREIGKISAIRNYTPQVDAMRIPEIYCARDLTDDKKRENRQNFDRLAIDKTSYIAHFSSKVRDCYKYDNNDLYMKLISQNCTFQIRAPQFNRFSTSKVMTSFVKNVLVLELVSRVIASARKRGLADDGIFSICSPPLLLLLLFVYCYYNVQLFIRPITVVHLMNVRHLLQRQLLQWLTLTLNVTPTLTLTLILILTLVLPRTKYKKHKQSSPSL